MKGADNKKSLLFGIPGFVLPAVGNYQSNYPIALVGSILLFLGLAFYAKSKGRSPAWCLLRFLSIIEIIIPALLRDKSEGVEWHSRCLETDYRRCG